MALLDDLHQAYHDSVNYPDLVSRFIALGMRSYTVDVVTSSVIYRFADGENLVHPGHAYRSIMPDFVVEKAAQAVANTQAGKTDYPAFMDEIAAAGVRFYEATLEGPNKRVAYIGNGGVFEEPIKFPTTA